MAPRISFIGRIPPGSRVCARRAGGEPAAKEKRRAGPPKIAMDRSQTLPPSRCADVRCNAFALKRGWNDARFVLRVDGTTSATHAIGALHLQGFSCQCANLCRDPKGHIKERQSIPWYRFPPPAFRLCRCSPPPPPKDASSRPKRAARTPHCVISTDAH